VASQKIDEGFFAKLESFNDEMRQKGLTPSTKVMKLDIAESEPEINAKLSLPPDDRMLYLERLRYADDEPIVHVRTWMPLAITEGLQHEDFTVSSLYQLLEDKYSVRITRVSRQFEAVNATPQDAALLNIKKGGAICLVRTVGFMKNNVPVEYSVAKYRGDKNRFSIDLIR
jgi:GntR family transcriptional regulator